jgi:predicted DNA-binding transcriptional regulator YafY
MSRRLERLIKLDELIRSPLRYTTADFAKLLEVVERTIGGDLAFLRDRYHAPLEYNFQQGWYYTNAEWRLPSIILSTGELFALTLGARMLSMYAGSAYQTQRQFELVCQNKQRVGMLYAAPGKPISEREFNPYCLRV